MTKSRRLKINTVLLLLLGMPFFIHSQEVRVIDNKGTKTTVRNTTVTTGSTAPATPVLNDIWFDTTDADHQRTKIWNGSSWQEITFTGTPGSVFFADTDGTPTQNNAQLFWDNTNHRLGVGTNTPSQSLDVNGYARVRTMDNAETADQVVKTDANGVIHTSKVNFGGRWTNTNTSTNLNVNNTVAPIFGSNDYVDDGTNLYEVSGNTLIVKESGRYDIRANLALVGIDDSILSDTEFGTNVNARIAVNGTAVGALGASGYISFSLLQGHNHSSIHVSEILELSANDVVTIVTYREANSGTVRFEGSGTSSFVINKLR